MPAKKKSQVETLPPEAETKRTRRQVVEAKHTVTYVAPEIIETPIEADEEEEIPEGESPEIEQAQRQPSFKTKIRERFKQRGIGVDETLNLRIDRLPFFKDNGLAGVRSDKEFCGILPCKEAFFENDDYLVEIQRRYGPGDYQLTVRYKNAIVSSWREHIGGFTAPVAVASSEPGHPPTIIYQNPMGQTPPPPPQESVRDRLREVAEILKLADTIRGPREEAAQSPARSEDEVLATAILKQPEMLDNVVGSLIKRYGRSGGDDDPSPWAVGLKLVESGQLPQIVKIAIDTFFNGINGFRGNNGNQTLAQTPHAQNAAIQGQTHQNGQADQFRMVQGVQTQPASAESPPQAGAHANGQQMMSPEQEALALVLDHCKRKVMPRITLAELTQREQTLQALINQHAMQTGQILTNQITLYLDLFDSMSVDEIFEVVKEFPGAPEVTSLPHAKEWTEALQKLIQENQEGDNEE